MTTLVRKAGLRPLDLYVVVMAAIGAAIAAWSAVLLPQAPHTTEWMLFSALALVLYNTTLGALALVLTLLALLGKR